MRLANKTGLVTGAGSGIGRAIARRFAAEGVSLVISDIAEAGLWETAALIGDAERQAVSVVGDVAERADAERMVQAAVDAWGRLDIVVNNAGIERGDWQTMLDVNLTGARLVAEAAVPYLGRRGGTIINVSSVAALVTGATMGAYSTSKAALLMLTRAQAVELGPRGIRANAICPGWVRTEMSEREMDRLGAARGISRAEAFALVTRHVPLRRPAEPEEIAAICSFLASSDSSFMTGAVLVVDGGSSVVDVAMLAFEDDGDTATEEIHLH